MLLFYITAVNKIFRHCHFWLARHYMTGKRDNAGHMKTKVNNTVLITFYSFFYLSIYNSNLRYSIEHGCSFTTIPLL